MKDKRPLTQEQISERAEYAEKMKPVKIGDMVGWKGGKVTVAKINFTTIVTQEFGKEFKIPISEISVIEKKND